MAKTKELRNKGAFKEQFKNALKYLRESGNYMIAVALIFLCGIFLGVLFFDKLGFLDKAISEIVEKVRGLDSIGLVLFILQNNITSAFYGLILGVFLGIFPIINAVLNGVLLGYVVRIVWISSGFKELWRILPHGIFEIPAIFISLSLGIRLGMFIFAKERGKELVERAKNSIIIFVCVILPLLIVAAIIEGLLIAAYR
ncbi:stage II sporulation protein M [Candidatus Pacearchaeota archaeon]|nr:stage II sporulation protein M [Candidatus Pacearchaeota archaeon]